MLIYFNKFQNLKALDNYQGNINCKINLGNERNYQKSLRVVKKKISQNLPFIKIKPFFSLSLFRKQQMK